MIANIPASWHTLTKTVVWRKKRQTGRELPAGSLLLPAGNLAVFWFDLDNGTVAEDEKPVDGKLQAREQGTDVVFGSIRQGLHRGVDEGLRIVRHFPHLGQSLGHLLFFPGQEHLQDEELSKGTEDTHPTVPSKGPEGLPRRKPGQLEHLPLVKGPSVRDHTDASGESLGRGVRPNECYEDLSRVLCHASCLVDDQSDLAVIAQEVDHARGNDGRTVHFGRERQVPAIRLDELQTPPHLRILDHLRTLVYAVNLVAGLLQLLDKQPLTGPNDEHRIRNDPAEFLDVGQIQVVVLNVGEIGSPRLPKPSDLCHR